ncbi:MAG: hypothetical protein ACXAC7_09420 [Candidatus Hodarchaeales archaeon]
MTDNIWLNIPLTSPGLFQLCGPPGTNYERYLYYKAIKACKTGYRVIWIDNHHILDVVALQKDLMNKEQLKEFYVFSPEKIWEFVSTVDDLDLFYLTEKSAIFIVNIFEFLVKNPRNKQNLELVIWILGHLKTLSMKTKIPIFITNELRKGKIHVRPFLSYLFPRFFSKVYILDIRKDAVIQEYRY